MLYPDRAHSIRVVESIETLVKLLTAYAWPLTAGFKFEAFLFLNDSTSLDAVQEYAVVLDGRAVESITAKELCADELRNLIARAEAAAAHGATTSSISETLEEKGR